MGEIESNIREALEIRGMTIKKLAEVINLTEAALHRMFDRDDYKFSTLLKIQQTLHVNIYDIIGAPPIDENTLLPKNSKLNRLVDQYRQQLREKDEKIMELKQQVDKLIWEKVECQDKYIKLLEQQRE